MADTTVTAATNVNGEIDRDTRLNMAGTDTLTVEDDAIFSVSANAQTVRFNGATNGAVISNNGTLENTAAGGRAIRFEASVGATLLATINNAQISGDDATITSLDDALQIQAGAVTAGQVNVNNGALGVISSSGGQGIDFAGAGGTFVAVIVNGGTISSQTSEAIRLGGGGGDVTNTGTLAGGADVNAFVANGDGLQYEDNTSGTVTNSGAVSGDRHALDAGVGSTLIVVNNVGGTFTGRNGSGVGSDGSATIINRGTITGAFANVAGSDTNGSTIGAADGGGPDGINDGDGDGVDVDGQITLDNYGLIQGTGAGGNGSDGRSNTSEGLAAGGGVINNYAGATISGAGLGILIDDSSTGPAPFLTTLVNAGTITGGTSWAIRIIGVQDDTITNTGTISGGGDQGISFGAGANTLTIGAGSSITGISDGGGGVDLLSYAGQTADVSADLTSGTASGTGGIANFENLTGGDGNDTLVGEGGRNELLGGGGADILRGGADADLLDGGDGLDAADYSDEIVAVRTVLKDAGKVSVYLAGVQDDTLFNIESVLGGFAADALQGNSADNLLAGNDGADTLRGGGGGDTLQGGAGDDILSGDAGADTLTGGAGFDRLAGGLGDDQIEGGAGNDSLTGQGGLDRFVYARGDGLDTIRDYDADDRLAFRAASFGLTGGDPAPVQFGAAATGSTGTFLYNAATRTVFWDADGAGAVAAERLFVFATATTLDAADFVLI